MISIKLEITYLLDIGGFRQEPKDPKIDRHLMKNGEKLLSVT